jgi:hypothetical protein
VKPRSVQSKDLKSLLPDGPRPERSGGRGRRCMPAWAACLTTTTLPGGSPPGWSRSPLTAQIRRGSTTMTASPRGTRRPTRPERGAAFLAPAAARDDRRLHRGWLPDNPHQRAPGRTGYPPPASCSPATSRTGSGSRASCSSSCMPANRQAGSGRRCRASCSAVWRRDDASRRLRLI